MAKKKDDRKAKKDAWRAKKAAEGKRIAPALLEKARTDPNPKVQEAHQKLEAAEAETKEAEAEYERLSSQLSPDDALMKRLNQHFSGAWKVIAKETRGFSSAEKKEFARRLEIMEEGQTITFKNIGSLAADIRAKRPQPDRREYVGQERATPEEQSVESYLEFLGFSLKFTREPNADADLRADRMRMYLAFREARVFHINAETYGAVHEEADRHTTTLAGLPYNRTPNQPVPEEDSERYVRMLFREGKRQPYPDVFPFPNVFLGYGRGVHLQIESNLWRIPEALRGDGTFGPAIHEMILLGHLMTADGMAIACFKGVTDKGEVLWADQSHSEAGWPRGMGLDPWILPHLIRIINDHRTFVIETEISKAVRSDIKKHRKVFGLDDYKHMPIPFYSLRLQSHIIKEKVRRQLGRPPKPKSYKTDVRGHERCRIRRGPLPIAPDLAEKLILRGYVIFSTNKLDEETYRRLSERGLGFKRSDEWMAVKATWVKEHMTSNDPQLPYVPAVRVAGKIRTPKKATGGWTDDPAAR